MITCPNCQNKAMSWPKKVFGLRLKCQHCGETLRHDVFWSVSTLLVFSYIGYFLMRYYFGPLVLVPVLGVACLVIVVTPLRHK